MTPFSYPTTPHVRRHGPQGYADYASFRPWLRDEFTFKCAFCLLREQWGRARGTFHLDHFHATARHPDQRLTYENLLYCCATCNEAKGNRTLSDPCRVLLDGDVEVDEDGVLQAGTREARRLVRKIGLNRREAREFRRTWIGIIKLAKAYDPRLYQRLMGFPDDLPNLARLRPPGGNLRPEGIVESYFVKRRDGTLPETT
jgi:hypothetical protein